MMIQWLELRVLYQILNYNWITDGRAKINVRGKIHGGNRFSK